MTRFTRAFLASSILLTVYGCGLLSSQTPIQAPEPESTELTSGLRLETIRLPTPGRLYALLVVDAGARDNRERPAVAALAADWAGAAYAPEVLPDATLFETTCNTEGLRECIDGLVGVLRIRPGTQEAEGRDDAISASLRSLTARRLRWAADDAAHVQSRALAQLFGHDVLPLEGLDTPERESVSPDPTPDEIHRFVTSHYGPSRAMLIVAGDVEQGRLRRLLDRTGTGQLPTAQAARREVVRRVPTHALSPRHLPDPFFDSDADGTTSSPRSVSASPGATSWSAAARWFPNAEDAGRALRLIRREDTAHAHERLMSVVAVRGSAALVVATNDGRELADLLHTLTRIRAWELESVEGEMTSLPLESPRALARSRGLAWALAARQAESTANATVRLGAAITLPASSFTAGRRGGLGRIEQEVRRLLDPERVRYSFREVHGVQTATLPNGVSFLSEAGPYRRTAFTILWENGARHDPPRAHGRAALLSRMLATHCRGRIARLPLRTPLVISPYVDAYRFGITVEASDAELLPLVLSCALSMHVDGRSLADARAELLTELSGHDEVLISETAQVLCPSAPGSLAPLGSRSTVANLMEPSLAAALNQSRNGGSLSISLVGPNLRTEHLRELGDSIAWRSSYLEDSTRPDDIAGQPQNLGDGEGLIDDVVGRTWDGDAILVALTYRAETRPTWTPSPLVSAAHPLINPWSTAAASPCGAFWIVGGSVEANRLNELPRVRAALAVRRNDTEADANDVSAWSNATAATRAIRLTAEHRGTAERGSAAQRRTDSNDRSLRSGPTIVIHPSRP